LFSLGLLFNFLNALIRFIIAVTGIREYSNGIATLLQCGVVSTV
jgi:hypothetical protein